MIKKNDKHITITEKVEFISNIGLYLKDIRKRLKMRQLFVCEKCNISQPYLSQIENNQRVIGMETLNTLLKFYNVEISITIKYDEL